MKIFVVVPLELDFYYLFCVFLKFSIKLFKIESNASVTQIVQKKGQAKLFNEEMQHVVDDGFDDTFWYT